MQGCDLVLIGFQVPSVFMDGLGLRSGIHTYRLIYERSTMLMMRSQCFTHLQTAPGS